MKKNEQIGVLGGTFNPPHMGHVHLAIQAADELALDRVLLIPDALPPHKETADGTPDAWTRLKMVQLAAQADPRLQADDCEIRRGGKSYTFDTLTELTRRFPDADLTFLCGTDMFLTLDRWYRAADLFRLARFAVAARNSGEEAALLCKQQELKTCFQADTVLLHGNILPISSTEVRNQLKQGDISQLDPIVADYIAQNNLFLFQSEQRENGNFTGKTSQNI